MIPADHTENARVPSSAEVLDSLWRHAALPEQSIAYAELPGAEPAMPSSFAVGTAARSALAAAGLAGAELWHLRQSDCGSDSERQRVRVDIRRAVLESTGYFTLDGVTPNIWDKLSGLYACGADVADAGVSGAGVSGATSLVGDAAAANRSAGSDEAAGGAVRTSADGWLRIHANFPHHRDGVLRLLGLPPGPDTPREAVAQALRSWRAEDFEAAAADAGLVVAAARSFDAWDRHPQSAALAALPLVGIEKIGDAEPLTWPAVQPDSPPLQGLRVLDLTRILAGPVAGRTLAAYGADVMLVNSPDLPNIESIADTSRGKLSALIDLHTLEGGETLRGLIARSHVFMQGYRPGALANLGFAPDDVAKRRPGIVYVSLSAYGHAGPWADKRGFDSLVQTATGFNLAEAEAAGSAEPKAMPFQVLDYCAGYLLAFGAQAALYRQQTEGGSWHVQVSLAGVAQWLRGLGRVPGGLATARPSFDGVLETSASGFGDLTAVRHAAEFSKTPPMYRRPSMPPGSSPARWDDEPIG
ncbi:MAG: carnitine dehydratase [Rhizobacter sp.]|nr:carnitine dehydratase [Rhizobacter sp.]